jgi:hypothetical protein
MALTEYEKKILEQMEASLREEDPALASQMSAPVSDEPESEAPAAPRGPRRIALGLTGAVLGMIVLVAAVSLGYSVLSILLGVAGFALTVAGVLYALSRPGGKGNVTDESASNKKNDGGGWDSFIQDQERRWDNRKDDD